MEPIDYMPADEQSRILSANLDYQEQFDHDRAGGFAAAIKAAMNEIGVPPRLQKAEYEVIPKAILDLRGMASFPNEPFGLVGPGGIGKSCALAWAIKSVIKREILAAGPTRLELVNDKAWQGSKVTQIVHPRTKTSFKWIGWPARATHMKAAASRREWDSPLATLFAEREWLCADVENRVLILDDIGMENPKDGAYSTDQLELLIDEAYDHEAKVFWTSNLPVSPESRDENGKDERSLRGTYGYRLVSRLIGLSPDAKRMPGTMPDLRVNP
jgi:hypothetical protein